MKCLLSKYTENFSTHHDDDSASNLKISRSKKRAADDANYEQYTKDWYEENPRFRHHYCG